MSTCRVAVIAGDGIGQEVIPAGIAAIDAAARDTDFTLTFTEFPWGCEYYLAARPDDGRRRLRAAGGVRRDLPRRDRRARRAGSTSPCGTDPADPPALRSVREPAADAAAAGLTLAAREPRRRPTSTWSASARTRRASTPASADASIVGTPHEVAAADRRLHAARHRAHPALRVRAGRDAAAQDAGQRDQVERAARTRWCCGTRSPRSCARTIRRSSTGSITSTRWPRGWSRTRRRST